MLAYQIHDILRIVPEAVTMIKEASLSEEFPVDSKDSALASGLCVAYLTKVAGEQVNYAIQEKVAKAAQAYGVSDTLEKFAARIETFGQAEKRASLYSPEETLSLQTEVLRGQLGFHQDLVKVASYAEGLCERFGDSVTDPDVLRYSASMPIDYGRLENALQKRAYETGDVRYNDVLSVVSEFGIDALNLSGREKRASVAKTIASLDQEHHYNGDIFKEAFVKQASYSIKLNSKSIPYEQLDKGKVGDILGKDVASALTGDFANDKAVIESLPMGEKAALERFF